MRNELPFVKSIWLTKGELWSDAAYFVNLNFSIV